jgi:hypothetical protein
MSGSAHAVLKRLDRKIAPLSSAQERLWFIDAAAPGSVAYNVPLLLRWDGPVDVAALAAALAAVAGRHAVLRTTYRVEDGRPVQVVHPESRPPVEVVDAGGVADAGEQVLRAAQRQARRPFDLAAEPPLRCLVWRGAPGDDWVLLCVHHIAIDGWSLAALFDDLAQAYDLALAGADPRLPELPVQYVDFAEWELALLAGPEAERQLRERVEALLAVPRGLELGTGRQQARGAEGARPGVQHALPLPAGLWERVAALARTLRVTPFVVLLSAFQVVLQRWSGREEFLVGAVMANRSHPDLEQLVGFFVNTVPLRCRVRPELSFRGLCEQVRVEAFRALTYQRIPFNELSAAVARSGPDERRSQLVDVGFALQNMPAPDPARTPRWRAPALLHTGTAKFDLTLIVEEGPDGVVATTEHATDCYPADLGRRVGESFLALLAAAVAEPDRPLPGLPIAPPGQASPSVVLGERRDLVGERMARLQVRAATGGPR